MEVRATEKENPGDILPLERVEGKMGSGFCARVEVGGEPAAVFEQLDAGQGRADADVKWLPESGVAESGGNFLRAFAEKGNHRKTGKETGRLEGEIGVEMADDGLFDPGQARTHGLFAQQEGQRGWVVQK